MAEDPRNRDSSGVPDRRARRTGLPLRHLEDPHRHRRLHASAILDYRRSRRFGETLQRSLQRSQQERAVPGGGSEMKQRFNACRKRGAPRCRAFLINFLQLSFQLRPMSAANTFNRLISGFLLYLEQLNDNMKKLFLSIFALGLIGAGCNQQTATPTTNNQPEKTVSIPASNTTTYDAKDFQFQISYPKDWTVTPASEADHVKVGYQFSNFKNNETDFYTLVVTKEPNTFTQLTGSTKVKLPNGMDATEYDNKYDNRVTEQVFHIQQTGYYYTLSFQVHHAIPSDGTVNPPALSAEDLTVRDSLIASFKMTASSR
ncbi:MAG: hypothetical protein JWO40_680 [Candidatus Doudnabacteria bacterium]|nr:hypothetical protein [Candidatus Doudnabacteria bacterium]